MGELVKQKQKQLAQVRVRVQFQEELQHLALAGEELKKRKRCLSKQLSMYEAWERKRKQEEKRNTSHQCDDVTDDDLHELKGCIELGFGFNEEDGQKLCNTLPALDLYFAVNRQLSSSPSSSSSSFAGSPLSNTTTAPPPPPPDSADSDWKICNPGDDPEHVKTKLRHWAQAVACSVMQSH